MRSFFHLSSFLQVFAFLFLISLLGIGLYSGAENLGYNWQWFRISKYLVESVDGSLTPGLLLHGMTVTLQIVACSLFLTFVIGLLTALLKLSGSPLGQFVANGYIELIRNTPLLVQIFVVYFVLAPVFDVGRFASAVLALSLFEGAYASEIIRAGILAIPRGQWDAAMALGMNRTDCYRHIVLPQALRKMAPPLTSQAVSLIKDSALVSTIAIYDLTMRGQQIVAETFLTFEVWITVAVIYLFLTLVLSGLVRLLEWRTADYKL